MAQMHAGLCIVKLSVVLLTCMDSVAGWGSGLAEEMFVKKLESKAFGPELPTGQARSYGKDKPRAHEGSHLQGLHEIVRLVSGLDGHQDNGEHEKPLCKEGQVAVPHMGHHKRLSANGCGPHGLQFSEGLGLHKCCNFHDICQSTCGTSHAFCEAEFRHCLDAFCKNQTRSTEDKCQKTVLPLTEMTISNVGHVLHARAQKKSCVCMPAEIGGDMHHQFLLEFLEEHDPLIASEEAAEELLKKWEGHEGKLYAGLVKKHGHKFVNFEDIAPEMPEFGRKPHHTVEHEL